MKIAHHNQPNKGFTLIEILVVITIIGVLSGLLFSGATAAMTTAKKADASNTAYNVRNAAASYYTEYRRQPLPDGASGSDYADFPTDDKFMDILLGADSDVGKQKNPRGIAFFTAKSAKPFGSGTFIKGVNLNQNGGGTLWDPFGRMYGVRMDTTNKGRMPNPELTEPNVSGGEGAPVWGSGGNVTNQPEMITETIAVWSSAKEEGSAKDNVKTW